MNLSHLFRMLSLRRNVDKTPFHKSLHWAHGLFFLLPDENLRREPSVDQLKDWRFLWFSLVCLLLRSSRTTEMFGGALSWSLYLLHLGIARHVTKKKKYYAESLSRVDC